LLAMRITGEHSSPVLAIPAASTNFDFEEMTP
jgi:hypothetical protein